MNTWQDSRNAAKCQNNPGSWRPAGGGCGTGKRGELYIRRHQYGADNRDTDDDTVGTERNKTDGRGAGMAGKTGERKIN